MFIKLNRTAIAFILSVVMLLSCGVIADAAYFSDVSYNNVTNRDAVNYVTDNGYMAGTSTTQFSPNTNVNRAMVVTVLYSMAGKPTVTNSIPFTDVSSNDWYYNPVRWAYANGIVSGTSSTTFSPTTLITRQQFAVMLYAYCAYRPSSITNGNGIINGTSITSAADYSSIATYARAAMRWCVDRYIITRTSSTGYLYPLNNISRLNLAIFVYRYCKNAEGIVFGKDNFSFKNTSSNFTNSSITKYYISNSDFNYISTLINNNASSPQSYIDAITLNRNKTWGGSCYGMSMAVASDKWGKIGFNENLPTAVSSMYNIGTPISNLPVLSRINLYQSAFALLSKNTSSYSESNISNGLQALVNEIKTKGVVLTWYYFGNPVEGHAIVCYKCSTDNNGNHKIWAYNPNNTSKKIYTISSNYSSCDFVTEFGHNSIKGLGYDSALSMMNTYDMDGVSNSLPMNNSQSNNTVMILPVSYSFSIENKEGEKLSYDAETLAIEGNMKQESVQFVDRYLLLEVDDSEEYHIVPKEGIIDFYYILWKDCFGAVEGNKIQEAAVSKDGAIKVTGNMSAWLGSFDDMRENSKLISVEGMTTGEEVSMQFNMDTIDIKGAEEVVAITYEKDEAIEHTFKNDKKAISISQKDALY